MIDSGTLVTFISRGFGEVHVGIVKHVHTTEDGQQFVHIASGGDTYIRAAGEEGSMWCRGDDPNTVAAMCTARALR